MLRSVRIPLRRPLAFPRYLHESCFLTSHQGDMLRILKVMYSLPEEGRELSDVFRWPFQLSVGFMDLLQTPTQECLAVIAHFAIIPEFLSSKWWLEGFGRRLLAKLYPLIDEEHLSWIQWPMQQLGISSEGGFPTSRSVPSFYVAVDLAKLSQQLRYTNGYWNLTISRWPSQVKSSIPDGSEQISTPLTKITTTQHLSQS